MLHFVEQKFNDVFVLSLKGKLVDQPETNKLHDKIASFLEKQVKNIVIDLQHVHRIASVGIGAILKCLSTVRSAGGDLRITGLSENVQTLFSVTKIIGIIKVYDSAAEAVKSFEKNK